MFSPSFWWTLVGVLLMISEFVIPGVILLFFGIGALITALLTLLIPEISISWQLGIFTVASLSALFSLRHWLKPIFTGYKKSGAADKKIPNGMIGAEGTVTRTITPKAGGKILLHGTEWNAKADETIQAGEPVKVINQQSLTLIVISK